MKSKIIAAFACLALVFSSIGWAGPHAHNAGWQGRMTPASVVDSVYKITAIQNGVQQWSGTGWMVDKDRMMTAGHVCDTGDEDGFTFRAMNRNNQSYPIKVIKWAADPDLCIMEAKHVPGAPLGLGPKPAYGDPVWYVGAPHGIFGDGSAPLSRGYFIGGDKAMIAGYPGASGSPIFTTDGVFGVIVAGWRGTEMMVFENWYEIVDFLDTI